jgi:hypothetical protein
MLVRALVAAVAMTALWAAPAAADSKGYTFIFDGSAESFSHWTQAPGVSF